MIWRNVPNNRIRYILGANGESDWSLDMGPNELLSCIDYDFIDSDKIVRARLLSNPVVDNLLELMIYCYLDEGDSRPAIPLLKAHQYLQENAVTNWANSTGGHMGNIHYWAPYYVPSRVECGNTNQSGDPQDQYAPRVSLQG